MPNNEWEDIQLEEFTLEDVLLEFGSKKREQIVSEDIMSEEEKSIIDRELFDEIKNENNLKNKPAKAPTKKTVKFSTLDLLRREKKTTEKKTQTPHAVSAQRAPVKKEKKARLDETLRLNDLFENKEDYDDSKVETEVHEAPADYVVRNALRVRASALRSIFAFLLCIPACYLSFAEGLSLPLPKFISWQENSMMFLLILCAMHLLAILLHIRIFSRGIRALFTLQADMLSMVATSSVATLMHLVYMIIDESGRHTGPYSAVCIVMLFFAGIGDYLRESARLRACKAASSTKEPYGIFISEREGDINLIKHPVSEVEPFTKYVTMQDGAERFWTYLAPFLTVSSIVFAIVSSFSRGDPKSFFWSFAAISTVASPFFTLLCYALPFSKITKKLSQLGAALSGWYAAFSLSGDRNLIMRDSDIFPKGTITSHGLKVFDNYALDKVVCYATSMVNEAKSGLAPVFNELLKSQYGKNEKVYHLMHHESGGMEADICGDHVLLGTAAFILRMGIRINENTNTKNTMYLAINGTLAAAFNLKYRLTEEVKLSLETVIRSRVKPVMASIDCNQTPVMIETKLHARAGSIEYPRIEERLDLASEDQYLEYDPSAFITRAGIMPFASAVLSARRLRKITIRNVVLSTICAILGMLLMFYITFVGSYESGAAYNVFIYMLLWTLAVYILSSRSGIN